LQQFQSVRLLHPALSRWITLLHCEGDYVLMTETNAQKESSIYPLVSPLMSSSGLGWKNLVIEHHSLLHASPQSFVSGIISLNLHRDSNWPMVSAAIGAGTGNPIRNLREHLSILGGHTSSNTLLFAD